MRNTTVHHPQSLVEAIAYFADDERAFHFVKDLRWPDGRVICPRCGHDEHSFLTTRRIWKCKGCRKQFSLKVGTIFEDSPIGWDKWLPAVWLLANSKNSVSSHELGRALHVTQKTAWFMFHRIRLALETETFVKLTGTVEVDETYIGGSVGNMHDKVRKARGIARGAMAKAPVQGAKHRDTGTVRAEVVPATRGALVGNVDKWVEAGSTVYTDDAPAYWHLGDRFDHQHVVHTARRYVNGNVHTNGIENFWSLLKRAIKGTQVHVDKRHMQRYVVERVFSYNNRKVGDLGRMRLAMEGTTGRRLTYDALTLT